MKQKIIHSIWIGNKPKPTKWMNSWKKKNPEWEYILWDNKKIYDYNIKNKKQFDYYYNKKKFDGATDILRNQILYEFGGFTAPADMECLRPIGDIFKRGSLFTISCRANPDEWQDIDCKGLPNFLIEPEKWRKRVTPIIAASKRNKFLKIVNEEISKIEKFRTPPLTTGNILISKLIEKHKPRVTVFPMHIFMPYHPGAKPTGGRYKYIGKEKPLAKHHWGTSFSGYGRYGKIEKKDLVYITKESKILKYAIRSATENIEHRRLVIVGPKPEWAKKVVHIPYIERHRGEGREHRNVVHKILKVCKDKRVTKDFLLMNDDFFFTKPYKPKVYTRGKLRAIFRKGRKKGYPSYYRRQQANVLGLFGKYARDYEVHCPIEINKKQFLEIDKLYNMKGEYLTRSTYGNHYKLKGEKIVDPKTSKWVGKSMFSTNDRIEKKKTFRDYIKKRFNNKSKYEK